jgi:hypothetical protein
VTRAVSREKWEELSGMLDSERDLSLVLQLLGVIDRRHPISRSIA